MNSLPMRVMFLAKGAERAVLLPHMAQGNRAKTEAAPVTAVAGHAADFYENMPLLFPHSAGARDGYANDLAKAERSARQSATLQIAYLIIALRSLGLDCGPMGALTAGPARRLTQPEGFRPRS